MNDSRSAAPAAAVGVPEAVAALDGTGHGDPGRGGPG
ncbi:EamA family transporter, partial [Streptomyces halstedii]|nr:EamA family transporter [Streptomyces halstedii]